jgi:hypothetical protein
VAVIMSVKFIGADGLLRYPRMGHCLNLHSKIEKTILIGEIFELSYKFIKQVLLDLQILQVKSALVS